MSAFTAAAALGIFLAIGGVIVVAVGCLVETLIRRAVRKRSGG